MARSRNTPTASSQKSVGPAKNGPKYDDIFEYSDDTAGALVARQDASAIDAKYKRALKDALKKLTENA